MNVTNKNRNIAILMLKSIELSVFYAACPASQRP